MTDIIKLLVVLLCSLITFGVALAGALWPEKVRDLYLAKMRPEWFLARVYSLPGFLWMTRAGAIMALIISGVATIMLLSVLILRIFPTQ